MSLYYAIMCFFVYGVLGWCGEVAFAAIKERRFVNRGFLNGPLCPIYGIGVVCVVQALEPYIHNVFILYAMSVVLTTVLEFATGVLLEKIFHHRWWDYSGMPFNIMGQICLPYSLLWIIVACIAIVADDRLRWIFFNEPKVTYHLFPKWKKYSENKK